MEERDEGPDILSKWVAIFSLGCSEQVRSSPGQPWYKVHEIRYFGSNKTGNWSIEHRTMDSIILRNTLTSDIHLL